MSVKIVLNFNKTLHNYVKEQNLQFENEGNIEILNSDKKVTKAIDTARHFAQLDLEHTHNITISNNDNKDIIQTNLIVNSNHKKILLCSKTDDEPYKRICNRLTHFSSGSQLLYKIL